MKRFIQTGIVIGVGFVLWQVSAHARFLDLKEQEPSPIPEIAPTPAPTIPPQSRLQIQNRAQRNQPSI